MIIVIKKIVLIIIVYDVGIYRPSNIGYIGTGKIAIYKKYSSFLIVSQCHH